MEADFLHEIVHAVLEFMGYREHDEKKVDELAQALYMVIQDNPEMFTPDKEADSESNGNSQTN
jgi:predicted metal-dependent peptidase